MPFPFSVSGTIIAGGIGPGDIPQFVQWLTGELQRSHATEVAFEKGVVRFRSLVTIRGPLSGIGGGTIDLRETGESGKVRFTISFMPLAISVAVACAIAVANASSRESVIVDAGVWAAMSILLFIPWYLVLPERFGEFLEHSVKRYYQSPLASSHAAPGEGA